MLHFSFSLSLLYTSKSPPGPKIMNQGRFSEGRRSQSLLRDIEELKHVTLEVRVEGILW